MKTEDLFEEEELEPDVFDESEECTIEDDYEPEDDRSLKDADLSDFEEKTDDAAPPAGKRDGMNPIQMYLKSIGEVPLLTQEQEVSLSAAIMLGKDAEAQLAELEGEDVPEEVLRELKRTIRKGKSSKDKMTEANLRLVVSIAKHYTGNGMEFLDLIQEGNVGLMKAVEKFDHTKGYRFSTYATWWIRQSITRALADHSRTIRVPVHMYEVLTKVHRVMYLMTQELGREPTVEELAQEMEISTDRMWVILSYSVDTVSLDMPVGSEGDSTLESFIPDSYGAGPEEAAYQRALEEEIDKVLDTLTQREQEIIALRFGLRGETPHTLEQIGQLFSITRERVRQVEDKAIRKLRHPNRAKKLVDFCDGATIARTIDRVR